MLAKSEKEEPVVSEIPVMICTALNCGLNDIADINLA